MGLFSASKDRLVETMAPGVLNTGLLAPYGRITELKLNSTTGELDVTLDLKGEVEPLRVHIQKYDLSEQDDKTFLTIRQIETSRAWLTALAENLALNRPLELPPEVAKAVARFL
jgi:hypothetical protein